MEYYKEAEKLEPENLYIQAYIGHTLMRLEKYEDALKYYYKVEYLAPDNDKIQRPIAWVSYILGKFETSVNYYQKIPDNYKNADDYIHMGHSYWCLKKKKKSIENYKMAFNLLKDYTKFKDAFNEDTNVLLENGISKIDIGLMKNYVLDSSNV